jgi:kynurenine formamidase
MPEIIDLSMEIYSGMPVHKSLPDVKMDIHATHEAWEGIENAVCSIPEACVLTFHTNILASS